MTDSDTSIDGRALDSLAVAPADGGQPAADAGAQGGTQSGNQERDPRQDAGRDKSIARRLEKNPDSTDARLDAGLDESMDASDPPASTQPVHNQGPPASSGYDEAAERQRA